MKSETESSPKRRIFLRITGFLVLFAVIFVLLNQLFQPVWYYWNNYDTTHDIYDELADTIETIFLGASIVANGVTPMELYEQYGICAYNLGMEQQPMQSSYYWLEEAYRLQGGSLKTVVLDVSMLRKEPDYEEFYRKTLDAMPFSKIKWRAVSDYTDGSLNEILSYLVPLFSYHSRWAELGEEDFTRSDYVKKSYTRGYNYTISTEYFQSYTAETMSVLSSYPDESVEEQTMNTASLYYLRQMIEFCDVHNLKLVLMKTPGQSLGSAGYNAVQSIADEYGLDFLDFNYEPLKSEIGYNHATDSTDGGHMNYYGAKKLTAWLGKYLTEECGATDVRGDEDYAFMEEQLAEYREKITDTVALEAETDPAEYLAAAMEHDEYTIFVAVKDDAAMSLTDGQRELFEDLGLQKLAELGFRDSYLAVIDEGVISCEQIETASETTDDNSDQSANDMTELTMEDVRSSRESEEVLYLTAAGQLSDDTIYNVRSGGSLLGNIASVKLDGTEYAINSRGINIVVYDKERQEVVDSALFDTYASDVRISGDLEAALEDALQENEDYTVLPNDLQKLYLYNLRCEDELVQAEAERAAGDDALLIYLDQMLGNERYAVFLAVKDEASAGLNDEVREALYNMGLTQLSELGSQDSYLAVYLGGELVCEEADHGETSLEQSGVWISELNGATSITYRIRSGGADSGNIASVCINDTEYAHDSRGINIVVWDVVTNELVASKAFDTCEIPVRLSEGTEE